jgi:hypothetical protein
MTFVEPKIEIVLEKLEKLSENKTPLWGSMSAIRMVEHLTDTCDLALGKMAVELEIPEDKIERAQGFIMSEHPLPKNFPASFAPASAGLRHSDLKSALIEFESRWKEYLDYYAKNQDAKHLHPNFGVLDFKLWNRLHSKHITHHLEQFDIL